MTADEIRQAIERVSVWAEDVSGDRAESGRIVAAVEALGRAELYAVLSAAGLETVRPRDSKAKLLAYLRNRLTARVRARERAEV